MIRRRNQLLHLRSPLLLPHIQPAPLEPRRPTFPERPIRLLHPPPAIQLLRQPVAPRHIPERRERLAALLLILVRRVERPILAALCPTGALVELRQAIIPLGLVIRAPSKPAAMALSSNAIPTEMCAKFIAAI